MSLQFLKHHALHPNQQQLCDVCQIVDYLLEYNLTLAFQGDSMMRQTFVGFECELWRRGGYQISTTWMRNPNRTEPRWRYGLSDTTQLQIVGPKNNQSTSIYFYAVYRPIEDMIEVSKQNAMMHYCTILSDILN